MYVLWNMKIKCMYTSYESNVTYVEFNCNSILYIKYKSNTPLSWHLSQEWWVQKVEVKSICRVTKSLDNYKVIIGASVTIPGKQLHSATPASSQLTWMPVIHLHPSTLWWGGQRWYIKKKKTWKYQCVFFAYGVHVAKKVRAIKYHHRGPGSDGSIRALITEESVAMTPRDVSLHPCACS